MRRVSLVLVLSVLALAAVPATAATGVALRDDFFDPGTKTVRKGAQVRFTNRGEHAHNVVVTKGPRRFRSELLRSGRSYSRRLRVRGTYRIVCTLHAGMRMTLRVR